MFGQARYVSRKDIRKLVHSALDLGVNLFDTASDYGHSESLLGEALRDVPRDHYHVATKVHPLHLDRVINAAEVRRLAEQSLRRLRVDDVDILQLHRVTPEFYAATRDRVLPVLEKLRSEGKVRYIGITESSRFDAQHRMLARALQDDLFDTVMVAYHLANTSAENEVFPLARANDVGVIGMTAARHQVVRSLGARLKLLSGVALGLFASPPGAARLKVRLRKALSVLSQSLPRQACPVARACGGSPLQLPEAAYTFVASQPAIATVLTGTTNLGHLERNIQAILAPALTAQEIEQLRAMVSA